MKVFTLPQARRGLVSTVDAILTGLDTAQLVWDESVGELRVVERHDMTHNHEVVAGTSMVQRLIADDRPSRALLMPMAAALTNYVADFEALSMDALAACTDPDRILEVLTDADMWPECVGPEVRDLRGVVLDVQNRPANAFTWQVGQTHQVTSLRGSFVQGNGPRSRTVCIDVQSPWVAMDTPRSRAQLRLLWGKWPTVTLDIDLDFGTTLRPRGALAVAIATALWDAYKDTHLIGFLQAQATPDARP